MHFKLKPASTQCPSTMTAQTVRGIVLAEHVCELPLDHEGYHRCAALMWNNAGELQRSLNPVNGKRLFLPT